jgi:hypothetical protein
MVTSVGEYYIGVEDINGEWCKFIDVKVDTVMEKTIYEILFHGLEDVLNEDEFSKRASEVIDNAFKEVFLAHKGGTLVWWRVGKTLETFKSSCYVYNANGEYVKIDLFLSSPNGTYLTLGEDGPCRNDASNSVQNLYTSITGKHAPKYTYYD